MKDSLRNKTDRDSLSLLLIESLKTVYILFSFVILIVFERHVYSSIF